MKIKNWTAAVLICVSVAVVWTCAYLAQRADDWRVGVLCLFMCCVSAMTVFHVLYVKLSEGPFDDED